MKQNNAFDMEANTKKMIVACGVTSLALGTLGVVNMVTSSYGIAGLAFGAAAFTSMFGMYKSITLTPDESQNTR